MSNDLLAEIRAKRQGMADKKTSMKKAYKFKPGKTMLRILPSWRDESAESRPFSHDFGQAFIRDLDNNLLAVIGDRKMTYGEDDAVRDLIVLAKGEAPTDAQREHYHQMLAKPQHLVNALVLNDSAVDPTEPQLVSFSNSQMENELLPKIEKLLVKGHNPLDLDKGFDLEISRVGTTKNDTRYSFDFERDSTKVDPKVMSRVIDLDSYVRAQFADTDRAINAIKSISQGALLPAPSRQRDMTTGDTSPPWNDDKVEEAEYSAVNDAKSGVREPVRTNTVDVSQDEIDAMLNGIV